MNVLDSGIRAKGLLELKRFSEGQRITRGQALKAKCYDCMGGYADGVKDCQVESCPLYPYMPYSKNMKRLKTDKPPVSDNIENMENSTKNGEEFA